MKTFVRKLLLAGTCLLAGAAGVIYMLPNTEYKEKVVFKDKERYNAHFYKAHFIVDGKKTELSFHNTYEDEFYPEYVYNVIIKDNYFNPFRPNHEIVRLNPRSKTID